MHHLKLLKYEVIDLAVGRLSANLTSSRSDEAVAAEVRVVEPLVKVTCLSDVKYFTVADEQVNA